MEELENQKNELLEKKKQIMNKYYVSLDYNKSLMEKRIDVKPFEKELKKLNKQIKGISKVIEIQKAQIKERQIKEQKEKEEEYPQNIKDLFHQARLTYLAQIQNIKNEYLKIKEIKEKIGA